MSKFEYTEEMVAKMHQAGAATLTEEVINELMEDFQFPRRSVTAKLRKLGYDVPKKPGAAAVFSAEETARLGEFLNDNKGAYTAEEVAELLSGEWDREISARQINGKVLSMEMTDLVKPADKKVTPKTYTDAEEATIASMVEAGAFMEDIAAKLGRELNSIRGKLLSMSLKAPQREKKAVKVDAYAGIEDMLDLTVDELAAKFGKTARGVKTVLTRRNLTCKDYTPKALEE